MEWQYLTSEDTLNFLEKQSHSANTPGVFLFKHSTRCSISAMALRRFEDANKNLKVPCFILNVIENREISNLISSKYSVIHQSPQVLWIKNGVCQNNTSHSEITATWLQGCIGK